jgi:membrane-associated phospholipid phosphatase
MSATAAEALRRNVNIGTWLSFVSQVLIAISFEVGDDLARGHFAQHGTLQGITNARHLVAFEASHGLYVEPAWQSFFLRTQHIFAWTLTWLDIAHVMNVIYIGGHVGVTLGVALWIFVARRRWFPLFRNIVILTNLFALLIYENFPVAPPRLTTGLDWKGHPFRFEDTVFGIFNSSGHLIGSQTGFNEFSAMPSVHVAWALIAGSALVVLGRAPALRIVGIIYPFLMLLAVIVTGNHYLLDAAAAIGVVIAAALVSGAWEPYRRRIHWPWQDSEQSGATRPTVT